MYKVIKTGSKGNAVVYHGSILVDCGVSYNALKEVVNDLKIVLLTHIHGDHFCIKTIKTLQRERPTLRIGCPQWIAPLLSDLNNIDVYECGKVYNYGTLKVSPVELFHDVPNCGYRIFKGNHKTIHCTDTSHLEGITAKGYDLYAIEHNYDEEKAEQAIKKAEETGEFCHAKGSVERHLSTRQAWDFIQANKKENSEVLKLHQSSKYY